MYWIAALVALPGTKQPARPLIYQHPSGLTLTLPSGWTQSAVEDDLSFLPPSGTKGNSAYALLLALGNREGVKAFDTPGIQKIYKGIEGATHFKRVGGASQVGTKVPGVLVEFQATTPNGKAKLYLFAGFVRQAMVSLILTGEASAVSKNRPVFEAMVRSLTLAAPQRDLALIGNWVGERNFKNQQGDSFREAYTLKLAASGAGENPTVIYTKLTETTENDGAKRTVQGQWYGGKGRLLLIAPDGQSGWEGAYTLSEDRSTLSVTEGDRTLLLKKTKP